MIVSTGAQSLMLGLENEARLIGHGVSTCATCDGFFFRDHEIAVVGGGDSAVEEAMFLTKFATKVTMIVRRDQLRASKIMQDRAFANPKIEIRWNSVVTEIVGDTKLDHLVVEDVHTGEQADLPVTGLFVAIGHKPNTDLVKGQLELEDNGYLVTGQHGGASTTNVEGVFACGDVQDHTYRQAITAAGSGLPGRHRRRALARSAGTSRSNICSIRRWNAGRHRGVADNDPPTETRTRHAHHPHRHHLRRGDRRLRRARPRRLLGRVVRSVQDDRPDPRRRSPRSRPAS